LGGLQFRFDIVNLFDKGYQRRNRRVRPPGTVPGVASSGG